MAIPHNGSRTAILMGNGDGTFGTPLIIAEPNLNLPQAQAVADFNGDGFQDLALALGDGNTGIMEILNGNGDGTFQPLGVSDARGTVGISGLDGETIGSD